MLSPVMSYFSFVFMKTYDRVHEYGSNSTSAVIKKSENVSNSFDSIKVKLSIWVLENQSPLVPRRTRPEKLSAASARIRKVSAMSAFWETGKNDARTLSTLITNACEAKDLRSRTSSSLRLFRRDMIRFVNNFTYIFWYKKSNSWQMISRDQTST